MKISKKGVEFIAQYEGFIPFVYDDFTHPPKEWKGEKVHGTLTIGYGHTNSAKHPLKCSLGTRITKQQALDILAVDLADVEQDVNRLVKVPLTQGQFDACVSFTYNCGAGNFAKIATRINNGDLAGARKAFSYYVTSKGKLMTGLVRRRADEQKLWDSTYPHGTEANIDVATPKTTGKKDNSSGVIVSTATVVGTSIYAALTSKPGQALTIVAAVAVVALVVGLIVHKIRNRKVDHV